MFGIEENGIGLAGWLVVIGGGITLTALAGGVKKLIKHLLITTGIEQQKAELFAMLIMTGFIGLALYKTSTFWRGIFERGSM